MTLNVTSERYSSHQTQQPENEGVGLLDFLLTPSEEETSPLNTLSDEEQMRVANQSNINYLIEHATVEPGFWSTSYPRLCNGKTASTFFTLASDSDSEDESNNIDESVQTALQTAIDTLAETLPNRFNLQALLCRQGAGGISHRRIGLDLTPLASSAFRLKMGENRYREVPTEVVRRSLYFNTLISAMKEGVHHSELENGVIDLTENPLSQASKEAWDLYFEADPLNKRWHDPIGAHSWEPVILAEVLQIADYFIDEPVMLDCVAQFKKGVMTYKREKEYTDAQKIFPETHPLSPEQLRENTMAVLDMLLHHDRYDVGQVMMAKHLADTSFNTIRLLQDMHERGIDLTRIETLSILDQESKLSINYDETLETISSLCQNIKSLSLFFPHRNGFISRVPEVWKNNLKHFHLNNNTVPKDF
ncbi:MAG: hypothetical protein KGI80_02285 [Verrucomicrobiota bacterium]|nr:hypothetical protein [Verrucomicrobiota bacterium]